jgi:hypothetical protein
MGRFLLFLVVLSSTLAGCSSVYVLGDWKSGQTVDHRLYSVVAPTIPRHEGDLWTWKSDSLESDDVFLHRKWPYEPGKLVIHKAAITVVGRRSAIKTGVELQKYVEEGGMEGVLFPGTTVVQTSQANLLCARPPLYREVTPEDARGHFVYIMACVDTQTRFHYELFVIEDVVNKDKTTPEPSSTLEVWADRFFAGFRVK